MFLNTKDLRMTEFSSAAELLSVVVILFILYYVVNCLREIYNAWTRIEHIQEFVIFSILFDLCLIDPLIGVVPAFGDIVSAVVTVYKIWAIEEKNGSKIPEKWRNPIICYLVIDCLIGFVPGIGDILDVLWTANIYTTIALYNWTKECKAD